MALRRGVIFTLIAIIVASVIVVSVQTLSTVSVQKDQPELLRVKIIDGVVTSFFSYSEASLRTATSSALTNLSYILADVSDPNKNIYFSSQSSFEQNLEDCILDSSATVSDSGIPSHPCITATNMEVLLDEYVTLVEDVFNTDISYALDADTFSVTQNVPFEIIVNVTMDVQVSDAFASWNIQDRELSVRVPLTGVVDPVTAKFAADGSYASPNIERRVKQNRKEINATSFVQMIADKEYRWAPQRAPSFMQRYYGAFDEVSDMGIETFINASHLTPAPWNTGGASLLQNYSFTDHELLGNTASSSFSPKVYPSCSVGVDRVNALILPDTSDTSGYFLMNISTFYIYGFTGQNLTGC